MSISTSLQKAAKLQEKIEDLRKQLDDLLNKARRELASTPVPEIPAALRGVGGSRRPAPEAAKPAKTIKGGSSRTVQKNGELPSRQKLARKALVPRTSGTGEGRGRSPLAGRKRAASPSGPLAPAVVKVLRSNGKPMCVSDILAGLLKNRYTFSSPEPKKNLAARIYRLSGVKQVAGGLFAQD